MKEQIEEVMKDQSIRFPVDYDSVDYLSAEIEHIIGFRLESIQNHDGDHITMTYYYNRDINKDIMIDWGAQTDFTDIDDLMSYVEKMQAEIKSIEAKIK